MRESSTAMSDGELSRHIDALHNKVAAGRWERELGYEVLRVRNSTNTIIFYASLEEEADGSVRWGFGPPALGIVERGQAPDVGAAKIAILRHLRQGMLRAVRNLLGVETTPESKEAQHVHRH